MEIRCADCGCLPSECKVTHSPRECPNCIWEECCCWISVQCQDHHHMMMMTILHLLLFCLGALELFTNQKGDGRTSNESCTLIEPQIIKDGTNSYTLSGSSSSIGSFDTTYRIAGERSAIRSEENLIISTITHDFRTSPTIGYVRIGSTTSATGTEATHPNPFATPQQITERKKESQMNLGAP